MEMDKSADSHNEERQPNTTKDRIKPKTTGLTFENFA